MSLFNKLKELIVPQPISENTASLFVEQDQVKHEFINFPLAYRIGILCYYIDYDSQEQIGNYKKKLEDLGYECEVLMFIDKKERENNIYLQFFDHNDLDKKTNMPNSPRTDRFIMKRYDMLISLYLNPCSQLLHIAKMSQAKCRVAPFLDQFKEHSDLMILCDNNPTIEDIIININKSLNLKPYERKHL